MQITKHSIKRYLERIKNGNDTDEKQIIREIKIIYKNSEYFCTNINKKGYIYNMNIHSNGCVLILDETNTKIITIYKMNNDFRRYGKDLTNLERIKIVKDIISFPCINENGSMKENWEYTEKNCCNCSAWLECKSKNYKMRKSASKRVKRLINELSNMTYVY